MNFALPPLIFATLLTTVGPMARGDLDDLLSVARLDLDESSVISPPPRNLLLSEWQFAAAPTDEGRATSEGGMPAEHHHHASTSHALGHAPIGVMGDHMHTAGEWMLSYRFMKMKMDGLRNGDSRISAGDVLAAGFPVTPVDMATEMHMWGLMYAPSDELTLMGTMSYVRKRMNHITGGGGAFKTKAEGLGDSRIAALIDWYHDEHHHVHLNLGLSIPSGSISRQDTTPAGFVRLPYPMQLGSGTWDLMPGITYNGHQGEFSWGAQALGTIRLGENRYDYSLGDRFETSQWITRAWNKNLSTSLRLKTAIWGNVDGADPAQVPGLVPTARTDMRGGLRSDILLGINAYVTKGPLKGHRFALEAGVPVWQKLEGLQLETDWTLMAAWQYAF